MFDGGTSEPKNSRLVEKRNFYIAHQHFVPSLGVITHKFHHNLWLQKLGSLGNCAGHYLHDPQFSHFGI